jgi:hypothetical protein
MKIHYRFLKHVRQAKNICENKVQFWPFKIYNYHLVKIFIKNITPDFIISF